MNTSRNKSQFDPNSTHKSIIVEETAEAHGSQVNLQNLANIEYT